MRRKSISLHSSLLSLVNAIYLELKTQNFELRIDEENAEKLLTFLLEKKKGKYIRIKKFARILYEISQDRYNDDLYGNEPPKGKNITAMKFKGKENFRIVCKEIFCDNKKVIMVTVFHKKSSKGKNISKKDLEIYKAVGDYEYDC